MTDTIQDWSELPEWISTSKAAEILNLKSTQAIRDFIRDGTLEQIIDAGTDKRSRYLVNRDEVIELARKRE